MSVIRQLSDGILAQLSRSKAFRKISKTSRDAFAHDVSLIALSVRTGYLVDVVQVPEHLVKETYSSLLEELAKEYEHFTNVLHLHDPSVNQSFLVNKSALLGKLKTLLDDHRSNFPVFVHLPEKGEPYKLGDIPTPLRDVLMFLLTNLKAHAASEHITSLQLPPDLSSAVLIPLAAILLDYPIAYVPASGEQTSFLSGVPLVVFRCYVQNESAAGEDHQKKEHVLLQFSCPEQLMDDSNSINISRVVAHLENTFQPRVTRFLSGSIFRVEQEHITLDRVAL